MSRPSHRWSAARLMLIGLSCSFAAAWLSGCGGEDGGPITSERSKYEVGDDDKTDGGPAAPSAPDRDTSPASVAGAPSGKGSGASTSTGKGATAGGTPRSPVTASEAGVPSDPYALPTQAKGTADSGQLPDSEEGLTALLDQLQGRQPLGATPQELVNIQGIRIQAAEKLWEIATDEEARVRAARVKLDSMRVLSRMGMQNIEKEITAYCRTLREQEEPEFTLMARLMLFAMEIDRMMAGEVDDEQAILDELKSLVEAYPDDPGVFVIVSQGATVLQRLKRDDAAKDAYRAVGNAFKGNADPRIARDALIMFDQARMADMGFDAKLIAMQDGEPDSIPPVKEVLKNVLSEEDPGEVPLTAAAFVAQFLEKARHYQDLVEINTLIEDAYKDHSNKELAERAAGMVAKARLRVGLVGKPFTVEGTLSDGSDLDWEKYQGKVVLVDFWATWSRSSLDEIPNIRDRYEEYREKGFEVVGVNVDNNPGDLPLYLKFQPLPWPTIVNPSADPAAPGLTHPLAIQCGVAAPPFTVLVGRDGNVVAVNVQGADLGERLGALLGAPAEDAAEPPTENQSSLVEPMEGQEVFFVSFQDEANDEQDDWRDTNPYLARQGLSPSELVDFIFDMRDRPKSIQLRPGFAEAVVEAAGRVLAAEAKERQREIAALAKFNVLHEKACLEDEQADKDLMVFVQEMEEEKNEKIAADVQFFLLERKAIDVDKLPVDDVPGLLDELKQFFTDNKLSERHLRMASSTVKAINRLEDGDKREEYFLQFGELFGKSEAKKLASYGKKLAKKPKVKTAPPDLMGKPLELAGVTALGTEFDWTAYRGKVVLVDFWATWCGPCRKQMPEVKALHERLSDRGFDIVGISLDRSQEALAKYLEENAINWSNLVGKEVRDITKKYGIRAVPTMILVDREGNVVAQGNKIAELTPEVEKLLDKSKP